MVFIIMSVMGGVSFKIINLYMEDTILFNNILYI